MCDLCDGSGIITDTLDVTVGLEGYSTSVHGFTTPCTECPAGRSWSEAARSIGYYGDEEDTT